MALSRRHTARLAALALITGFIGVSTGVAPAYADDPVAGGLTAGDTLFPNQGNSGYDALHYDINLKVNVAVSGTNNAVSTTTFPEASASIKAATTGAPLSSYAFDFQGSTGNLAASTLNVNSVTVDGVPATFTRIETTTTSNATTDVHKLIVTPATPVSGEFTTVVNYSGTPKSHTDTDGSSEGWNNTLDGATFLNQPVGAMTAFPNNNTPRDKATYTFTIDAPSKLNTSNTAVSANPGLKPAAVVSNGELISKTPSGDGSRTTWVWDEAKPMASELSLISVGRYDMYESDLALASGRTIKEWSFIDPSISVANQQTTQATRAQLKSILDFLESKYGPYPGNSTGLVTDIVPSAINYALETQDRSFFPNSASRGTTTHEVMHQWFGDGVSPGDWNDIWLNEGPATYAEVQVPYESSGASTTSTESSYYSAWNSSSPSSSLWTTPTAAMTQASQLFGSQVYTRGAWTLEALRTAIGPTDFATIMKQWQIRYSGKSKRTSDFIALAEEISGRSLTTFFQPWLYGNTKAPWPAKFDLSLVGPAAPTSAGDPTTYTLSSRNNGKVTQTGSIVTVDMTDVLDDATLGTLPSDVTISGNTLTWTVPSTAVGATSTAAIPVTVNVEATGATLKAKARASTLGSTCISCAPSLSVGSPSVAPSAIPTITGTPVVGQTLTAVTAGWAAGTTFAYQWTVDNSPVPGATSSTYVPDLTTPGFAVRVQVTGSKGSASPITKTSDPTLVVVRSAQAGSTPTISGTPKIGKPLTVDVGAWEPGTFFTYQWLANGVNVSGATGPIFTPSLLTQVGQTITVTITGTKAGFANTVKTSAATASVVAGEFGDVPAPTLNGTPRGLASVAAVPGYWEDNVTFTYAWSADGTPIGGATSVSYTPTLAQVGSALTVAVTGTKPGYSSPVTKVSEPVTIAPANQTLAPTPTITGTPKVGVEVTATPGTWDAGTTLTYQWLADGVAVDGAVDPTFTPTSSMAGDPITVAVTSTKTSYATVTKTSAPTVPVADGDLILTPVPTIGGTPKVGVELSADAGTWDSGVTLSYQWFAGGDAVDGETDSTFTPGPSQLGDPITVAVTGTKSAFVTATKISDPTDVVGVGDQVHTPTPGISGTPKVGVELTVVPFEWDEDATLTYQWSVDGDVVDGATGTTFTPGVDDAGDSVTVAVTGTETGYVTVTKTSDSSDPVADGDLALTPKPTISGTPKVGVGLTAVPGTWDSGVTLTYQWFVNGDAVDGETSATFTPTAGQAGGSITVAVTGAKTAYVTVTKTSDAADAVAVGDLALTPVPTINGTPKVGVELTAVPGSWDSGVTLSYQWFADGDPVDDETDATFTPGAGQVGDPITVTVTGSKTGFASVTKASDATGNVVAGELALTPKPTITGTPKVGVELTAVPGAWDSGVTLSYQWFVDGDAIVGATSATYTPDGNTTGDPVEVAVTGTKAGYGPVTKTSDATANIDPGELALTPVPTISGAVQVGKTVTAAAGTWDSGTSLEFQWQKDGVPISGATSATYVIKTVDYKHLLSVVVTGLKPGYVEINKVSAAKTVYAGVQTRNPKPTITGTRKVGKTLRVNAGTHDAGVTLSYIWYANGKKVGSNKSSLKLTKSHKGKRITVRVTAGKHGYLSVFNTSAPTGKIKKK